MKVENQTDMEGNDDCKLKMYSKRNKRAPVLIADFKHGEVKSDKNDLKFQCLKKDNSATNVGCDADRKLVATNGRLNYVGVSNPSAVQYFVGLKNKTTGKMKLYDCVLFPMKPDLRKMISCSQPNTVKSYWEGMNELTQNFGSKTKKRALSTLQKCTVDTSLDESLTIDDSFLLPSPDKSSTEATHHKIDYLPPQNRNAPIPSEVFNINDVISLEEDSALNQEVQDLLIMQAEFEKRSSSFCKYVGSRFNNVNVTKAKYLLYYNYLVIFQNLKYADIRKKDPTPHIPNPHKKRIIDKFTLNSSNDKGRSIRSCPTQMKDKLISYILVLALFIDEFRVNLEEIRMDLYNVGVPKLKTIAEVLGCTVNKKKIAENIITCAELKIPLYEVTPRYSKKF